MCGLPTLFIYRPDEILNAELQVHVVDSPYTVKSTKEGFVFHVIPIGQKLSDEYACLQREMNKHCVKSPHLQEMPKVKIQSRLFVIYLSHAIWVNPSREGQPLCIFQAVQ